MIGVHPVQSFWKNPLVEGEPEEAPMPGHRPDEEDPDELLALDPLEPPDVLDVLPELEVAALATAMPSPKVRPNVPAATPAASKGRFNIRIVFSLVLG
jgi:hypothetical protein